MKIDCARCGSFEISPALLGELSPLPTSNWLISRLLDDIVTVDEPKMIWRSNVVKVDPLGADKPAKLLKRFLRVKAEGKLVTGPMIFHAGDKDNGT